MSIKVQRILRDAGIILSLVLGTGFALPFFFEAQMLTDELFELSGKITLVIGACFSGYLYKREFGSPLPPGDNQRMIRFGKHSFSVALIVWAVESAFQLNLPSPLEAGTLAIVLLVAMPLMWGKILGLMFFGSLFCRKPNAL